MFAGRNGHCDVPRIQPAIALFAEYPEQLQNCRLFYQLAQPGLELIPYDRRYDNRTLYNTPVRFVIYNKETDLRSYPAPTHYSSWGI